MGFVTTNENFDDEWLESIYVGALERERDWIHGRIDAIAEDVANTETDPDTAIVNEYKALAARLDSIDGLIGVPDEETLWVSDEISAQITEEELAKARERLDSATERLRYWRDMADLNKSYTSIAEKRELWVEIERERQEEVFRLENLLIDNPASGWLPF